MMEAERCKLITCILPNDGSDRELRRALKTDKEIIRTTSLPANGMAALADARTKSGELPEPTIVRMVQIVVNVGREDDLFDYVYRTAKIGRPGGGMMYLSEEFIASSFNLPQDLPEEV